jgi:hypothetical protein
LKADLISRWVLAMLILLKMEAICSSETPANFQRTTGVTPQQTVLLYLFTASISINENFKAATWGNKNGQNKNVIL